MRKELAETTKAKEKLYIESLERNKEMDNLKRTVKDFEDADSKTLWELADYKEKSVAHTRTVEDFLLKCIEDCKLSMAGSKDKPKRGKDAEEEERRMREREKTRIQAFEKCKEMVDDLSKWTFEEKEAIQSQLEKEKQTRNKMEASKNKMEIELAESVALVKRLEMENKHMQKKDKEWEDWKEKGAGKKMLEENDYLNAEKMAEVERKCNADRLKLEKEKREQDALLFT